MGQRNKNAVWQAVGGGSLGRRRILLGMGAAGLLGGLPASGQAGVGGAVSLELFTSQGCSSCPPAERVLAKLADRPDIVALSYHVAYWDHIGWTDPYGEAACLERQERYRAWLKTRFLYTPQIVVAGRYDVVGSREAEVEGYIAKAAAAPQAPMSLVETYAGARLRLGGGTAGPKGAAVLAVRYLKEATTRVERGENAGRVLKERNIVREVSQLALWHGQPQELALPGGPDRLHGQAILLQDLASGAVLAAAKRPAMLI